MTVSPEDIIQAVYDGVSKSLRANVVLAGGGEAATEAKQDDLIGIVTPGMPEHHYGTAQATPQQVTFSGPTSFVVVQNNTASANLEVSFDGGASFLPVIGQDRLALPCRVTSLHVKSDGSVVDYHILATV